MSGRLAARCRCGWVMKMDNPMAGESRANDCLRIDKEILTADGGEDNVTAGSAINWLRYMEITHSWTKISVNGRTNDAGGHYRQKPGRCKTAIVNDSHP